MAEYIGDLSIDGSEGPWHAIHGGDDLVRCSDCAKYAPDDCPVMPLKKKVDDERIGENPYARVLASVWFPDGYCAWGLRKEDA